MPTYEIITTEVVVTTTHVQGDSEEDAVSNLLKGTVVKQIITDPELQAVNPLAE